MLKKLKQATGRDKNRKVTRAASISLMNTPQTFEPSNVGAGSNVYLKGRHFLMMMGAALAFHVIAIYGLELLPSEEVTQVPVRSMSLKLGGDEEVASDGEVGGNGSGGTLAKGIKGGQGDKTQPLKSASDIAPAPAPAKQTNHRVADMDDAGLPDALPPHTMQVAQPPAPVAPVQPKAPPKPAPIKLSALPMPALPMQSGSSPMVPTAPKLESVEVADKRIAAVAEKPVIPKVSASTTQDLRDLPLKDKNFPAPAVPLNAQPKDQEKPLTALEKKKQDALLKAEKLKDEKLKQEQLKAEKLKVEKLKAEQLKKMQLSKSHQTPQEVQKLERADVSDQRVAAAGEEGKRYRIGENTLNAQHPIPANVPAPTFRLPLPKPGAQTPESLGVLPPAPAIAPHPTQYVRGNEAAPAAPAPAVVAPASAAAVAAGIGTTPINVAAPAPTVSAPTPTIAAPTPTMGAPAVNANTNANVATAPVATSAAGTGTNAAIGAGTGTGAGVGAGDSAGKAAGSPAGSPTGQSAGEKAAAEVRKRYETTISQWIAKHKVYPAGALLLGQHGKVVIRLRIDRSGNVKFSGIEQSSGFKLIDRAALDMVARANPVPAVPADYPPGALLEFLVPASFDLQ